MELDWTKGRLAQGLLHYAAGEYFAAHEEWEGVWLEAQGAEKMFLQGVIQVAAAFHHYQRDNPQGTVLLLQAALRRLDCCPTYFGGISVAVLRDDIRNCLSQAASGNWVPQLLPPRIQICGTL